MKYRNTTAKKMCGLMECGCDIMDRLQNRDVQTENSGRSFCYSVYDSPAIAAATDMTLKCDAPSATIALLFGAVDYSVYSTKFINYIRVSHLYYLKWAHVLAST